MDKKRIQELMPSLNKIITLGYKFHSDDDTEMMPFDELRKRLRESIEELDYYDVVLLMSVMYIGRDEYIPRERYEDEFDYLRDKKKFEFEFDTQLALNNMCNYLIDYGNSKSTMIEQIISKTPFPVYVEQGFEVLKINRIK